MHMVTSMQTSGAREGVYAGTQSNYLCKLFSMQYVPLSTNEDLI